MKRARIIEVNYHDFLAKLQRAADIEGKIEKTEKEKWSKYIRTHNIKEAAFLKAGAAKFSNVTPVIIDHDDEWDGIYLYSKDDEACLKWVVDA